MCAGFATALLYAAVNSKRDSLSTEHLACGAASFGNSLAALLAILVAAAVILLTRWIYWLLRHREGVGLGDAKLMAMLAAWLGLPGALLLVRNRSGAGRGGRAGCCLLRRQRARTKKAGPKSSFRWGHFFAWVES